MASFSAWSLHCGLLSYCHFVLDVLPEFSFTNRFFFSSPEIGTVCHLHIVEKSMEKYWWPAYVHS